MRAPAWAGRGLPGCWPAGFKRCRAVPLVGRRCHGCAAGPATRVPAPPPAHPPPPRRENIELISDRPLEVMLAEFKRLKDEFPDRVLIASIMEEYNKAAVGARC